MSRKLFSILKYLVGWPLSLVAIIFILRIIAINGFQIFPKIKLINFTLLSLGIFIFIIYFFLRAFLWKALLKDRVENLTFKKIALFWSMSELKRYIPGSIWSFAARTASFESSTLSKRDIVKYLAKEAIILCLSSFILSYFYIQYYFNSLILSNLFLFLIIFFSLIFVFCDRVLSKINTEFFLKKIILVLLPNNNPFENFKLLLLGILSFFAFGIGTYFSLISIFYTDINNMLILSSLFILAFFIGYISLITPMGLGIRESITTFGLLSFIGFSSAALFSLFSRIIFIIAEFLSLLVIIFWNNINQKYINKIEQFISKHKYEILLAILTLIYIFYFTFVSFLRYDNFYTGRFDLGNMDQTVWNTAHGRIFQLTDPDGTLPISRLSVHADFILILISPLYLLFPNPKILLFLQTFILALGAFAVFLISKEIIRNKNISLAFSITYLLNPAIQFTNLYDFHPVTLATTFLLFTFYFFLKRKYILFLIFAILAGLTKEEEWAIVGIFGIFIAIRSYLEHVKDRWKNIFIGIIIFIIGVLASYLLIGKIIPLVKGSDHFALSYYSDFGGSTTEILKNIIFNPLKTIFTLLGKDQIYYLEQLFGPLGFLSILSPLYLIFAIPDLLIDLLSNNLQLHQIYYQYSASITPFIFISSIFGAKYLVTKIKKISFEHVSLYLIFSTLFFAYITGPLPATKQSNTDMISKPLLNSERISKFLSKIPKKYSIASTNNLGSHLSRRQNIYTIPIGLDRADVIAILIDHGFSSQSIAQQNNMIENLRFNKNYTLEFSDKDFFIFVKKGLNFKLRM